MSDINLLELPTEVLEKILEYLGNQKELTLVCKDFYRAVCRNQERDIVVTFKDHDLILTKAKLTEIISLANELHLDVQINADNIDSNLIRFFKEFNNEITTVKLSGSIYESDFYKLIENVRSHQTLRLEYLRILKNDHGTAESFIDNIAKLEINVVEFTELRVWEDREHSSEEYRSKLVSFMNTIDFIKRLKDLKVLRIFDKLDYAEWKLADLLSGLQLEELELTMIRTIAHDDEIVSAVLSQRGLKVLKIHHFRLWTDFFEEITEKLTNLTTFEGNLMIVSSFVLHTLDNLKNLTNLEVKVKNYDQVDELRRLRLKSLTKLKIHHHKLQLDEPLIAGLAKNFPQLTYIGFCGDVLTTIDAIFTHFNFVEHLHVSDDSIQRPFEDESFVSSSHRNERLKTLVFYVKSIFNLAALNKFTRDFPNMAKIVTEPLSDISVCSDICGTSWHSSNFCAYADVGGNDQEEEIEQFIDTFGKDAFDGQSINFYDYSELRFKVKDYKVKIDERMRDASVVKIVTFDMDAIQTFYDSNKLDCFMGTTRDIKHLKIRSIDGTIDETFKTLKSLIEAFGQKIQTFTIDYSTLLQSCVEILQLVPNVESLRIIETFETNETETVTLNRVKSLQLQCGAKLMNLIKVPNDTLTSFSLTATEKFPDFLAIVNDFLANQRCLKVLSLRTPHDIQRLPENFLNGCQLEELTWDIDFMPDPQDFIDFLRRQRALKRLKLVLCNFLNSSFEDIASLDLDSLCLLGFDGVEERGFRSVLKMSGLRQLGLSVSEDNESAFGIFGEYRLPRLERFYIDEDDYTFDQSCYGVIASCMPNLKTFHMVDSGFYFGDKYEVLLRCFNRVEEMCLCGSNLPKELMAADVGNESLSELDIGQLIRYEVADMQRIAGNFPNLTKFSFQLIADHYASEEELKESVMAQFRCLLRGLKSLKLFSCPTVHAKSSQSISFACDEVESLINESSTLEFFMLCDVRIENFDKLRRSSVGRRFDVVRIVDCDKLLVCNKEMLARVKDRGDRLRWNFPRLVTALSEIFYLGFEADASY